MFLPSWVRLSSSGWKAKTVYLATLQEEGIKSVVIHSLLNRRGVLYMRNAHQRMKCFHPNVVIELLYGIKEKFLHNLML